MRKVTRLLAAGVVAAVASVSAQATLFVTSQDYGFTAYPAGVSTIVNFDTGAVVANSTSPTPATGPAAVSGNLPTGFSLSGTNYAFFTGGANGGSGAAPATDGVGGVDTSKYLSVYNGTAALKLDSVYTLVSLYWGSIDTYNTIQFYRAGALIGTSGADNTVTNFTTGVLSNGSGNQQQPITNRRVTIGSNLAFDEIRISSSSPAFELDNVGFGNVPEAATWMMMLAGFGMMGFAMRRRPRTAVTFG